MKFRVFRIVYPGEGQSAFEYRDQVTRVFMTFRVSSELASLAATLREEVLESWKRRKDFVMIRFCPFGDVEHYEGLDPCRCHALSEKEQLVFWKAYSEISKGGSNG